MSPIKALMLSIAVLVAGCNDDNQVQIDPYSALPGKWGWAESDDCKSSPEEITFSADRKQMFLSHAPAKDDGTREPHRKVTYQILREIPNGLSMSLDGEKRLDKSGNLVTWDLILLSENEYCWHGNDWRPNSCTKSIHRCEI